MFRLLCIAILITGLQVEAAAQNPLFPAGGRNFDPVVFLSTLKINQHFGQGKIRPPRDTRVALVDSIKSNQMTVGFSMLIAPDSGDGWNMWIDFDADRYYRPRLVRVFAQRRVKEDEEDAFPAFRKWVQVVQAKNFGDPVEESATHLRFPSLRNTDYWLIIRSIIQDGAEWLTMSLDRMPPEE